MVEPTMDPEIAELGIANALVVKMAREEKERFLEEVRGKLVKGQWMRKGAELLLEKQPMLYDDNKAWWQWSHAKNIWEEIDDIDVLNHAHTTLKLWGDTSVKHKQPLLTAIMQLSREKKPKEPPLEWIQFGNEFYDLNTGNTFISTPEYFSVNAIPYQLATKSDTPVLDKLFEEWVGKEHVQTLYEIIAYSVYRDYPIHRIFCLLGSGANGKTRFMKIVEKFIGENKASVSLKRLSENQFAVYSLYKKLVCFVSETTHHRLESTEILKGLSGQDPITFEAKGRDAFTGQNYAKLIIGTNTLPPANDTSNGWYRRWLVIKFPNDFTEEKDILKTIPELEYACLARKCVEILPGLLARGKFHTDGSIEQKKAEYVKHSNPIKDFIDAYYERDVNGEVKYSDCFNEYLSYLQQNKHRRISKKEFTSLLEDEGLTSERKSVMVTGGYTTCVYVIGLQVKNRKSYKPINNNTDNILLPVQIESGGLRGRIQERSELPILSVLSLQDGFPAKKDIVDSVLMFKGINESISVDMIIELYPGDKQKVYDVVSELKREGMVFEPRPGELRFL